MLLFITVSKKIRIRIIMIQQNYSVSTSMIKLNCRLRQSYCITFNDGVSQQQLFIRFSSHLLAHFIVFWFISPINSLSPCSRAQWQLLLLLWLHENSGQLENSKSGAGSSPLSLPQGHMWRQDAPCVVTRLFIMLPPLHFCVPACTGFGVDLLHAPGVELASCHWHSDHAGGKGEEESVARSV